MHVYEHRQSLVAWISVLIAGVVALLVYLAVRYPLDPVVPWLPAVMIAICVAGWWMISVMITRVDGDAVTWCFTWGWPGGRISFDRIARVERTKLNIMELGNAGIHWTIWHGWLWNVGGIDAVEIYLNDGVRVTLGTNDPQGLVAAIETARAAHR
jgi:hypothetical protein